MKLIDGHSVIEHAEVNGESREFIRKLMDYIEDADVVEPTVEIDAHQLAKLLREGWTIHSEPKQGEWIAQGDCGVTKCNRCGWSIEECIDYNFCPDCGARMKGADDE